jgi:hypothetical protein
MMHNNSSVHKTMRIAKILQTMLPRFEHSLVFFLLLLLSICSATDSFQQLGYNSRKEQRTSVSSVQTATATTSITFTPAICIYGGGGAATTDTASSPAGAAQSSKRWRWNIFEPSLEGSVAERRGQRRRQRRRALDDEEYQRRKKEWADRYTTLEGLRETFGSNKNKLYGDLDPATTRRLYKSLLPTAVCELVLDVEVRPEELAELAYEARKAAKLYARERCQLPARLLANWYDGFRALRRYGRFQTQGMSYDQIFDKYYQRSALEQSLSLSRNRTNEIEHAWSRNKRTRVGNDEGDEWTEEDIVARTCMKILESACRTNPLIDRMTLPENQKLNRRNGNEESRKMSELENLERIAQTLEDDVRKLLDPYNR